MKESVTADIPRYLTGLLAVALSLFFLYTYRNDRIIAFASSFFLIICVVDTLFSKIPNLANLLLTLGGLYFYFTTSGVNGLLVSFLGILVGLAVFIGPYLLGGVGAGDVKAFAALGALLGPGGIFQVFLYTAIAGGIMAVFHFALAGNLKARLGAWVTALKAYLLTGKIDCFFIADTKEKLRFPYAAAIAFGYYSYIYWGGIIPIPF